MLGLKRGDLPEQPPKGWDQLDWYPGTEVKRQPPGTNMDALCRAMGINNPDDWNARRHPFGACVVNGVAYMPAEGTWDKTAERAWKAHEASHQYGLAHDKTGHNWFTPDGKPAGPLSAQDGQAMVARILAQQASQKAPRPVPPQGLLALGGVAPR